MSRPRMIRAMLLTLAGLTACTRPAPAAGDGGTVSVFALGAGNRALAMGGAFSGCADDASAMVWNPGGLGLVDRAGLEAVYSGDLGLAFRESYGSLVLPNWRLGTLGLSFRQFGVHGIDQRDDRNSLISGDLSDVETEVAIGFGRKLGAGLSLGGTVRMQRQSLAGFSAGGFGADIGAVLHPAQALGSVAQWAHRWTLGLSVRNALAPVVRLDQEGVSDPPTLRAGMAYRIPLGTGWILAASDLEKTGGVSSRLHSGVEFQPFSATALRFGLDGRNLTAGAGLRLSDLTVDYVFRNGDLAREHRLGLALEFGPTVEESRLAHRTAEDEALQRLLAEEFRKRQAAQVAGLLERAQTEYQSEHYNEALDALSVVATLEPGNARAAGLEAACLVGKASHLEASSDFAGAAVAYDLALKGAPDDTAALGGATRCRAESDRRAQRSTELRERFATAMKAFASDDLTSARIGFSAILEADSRDTDAREMLTRTNEAMTRRAADLLDQAGRLLRANLPSEAAPLLEQASRLDPNSPGLRLTQAALARAQEQAEATRTAARERAARPSSQAERVAPEGPRLSDSELEGLYRRGLDAQKARRSDEALHYMELVWASSPDYRGVSDYLKREYLTRGMESFAAGRLDEAVGHWEKVLRIDPTDTRARGYLARAQQQLARSREILGNNR